MKKLLKKWNLALPLGILSVLLVLGIMSALYLLSPNNYLALDVNPSVEIHTNHLNNVVSVTPVNEDAKQLLAGYELTDKNLEAVIKNIVDRMILNGYIAPDKDNQILITSLTKNADKQLTQNVDGIITSYLGEKKLNANVLQQRIDASATDIENAHENNVSAGKMALIEKLLQADSSLTLADLSEARVSDLIALAKAKSINLVNLVDVATDPVSTTTGQSVIRNTDEQDNNDEQGDIKNADEQDKDDEHNGIKNADEQDKDDKHSDVKNTDKRDKDDKHSDVKKADEQDKDDEHSDIKKADEHDKDDEHSGIKNAGKQTGRDKQSDENNPDEQDSEDD